MSKIQAKNAAVLSVADTIERTTGRHAQKKPPRAVSGDFSAIADGYIRAATAESTRRNFASDMRHLESNDIFPESPPAAVLEYLAKFAGVHKVGTLERRLVSLHKAAIQKKSTVTSENLAGSTGIGGHPPHAWGSATPCSASG